MQQMKLNKIFIPLILLFAFSCSSEKKKLIDQIKDSEQSLLSDTVLEVNPKKGKDMRDLYLKYASDYATDTIAAGYLFKAADLSNGMHDPKTAVELLDRLLNKFPSYSKKADALFLQAFLYDTELKNIDSAKVKYKEFVRLYPDNPLTPSAIATVQQLESGLSDEEMIAKFKAMNDSVGEAEVKQ